MLQFGGNGFEKKKDKKKKKPTFPSLRRLRLCLVYVKYFPEMLFSGKENIFKCLVAFQKMLWKIFYGVWLYSWKYYRKHIFYLLLIFSHIFSSSKQIYNIISKSTTQKKQNQRKKNHQIRSNWGAIAEVRLAVCGFAVWLVGAIGAVRLVVRGFAVRRSRVWQSWAFWVRRSRRWCDDLGFSVFAISLCVCACESFLSLFLSLRIFGNDLKVKFWLKIFSGSKALILGSTEILFRKIHFPCATKHPHLWKNIYGKTFTKVIWNQNKHNLRMKLQSKRINLNLVHWIHWDLDTCQVIVMYLRLYNEISIISSIASYHEITLPLLVIYLFIILKKEKNIKWRNHYQWIDFYVAVASNLDPSATPK